MNKEERKEILKQKYKEYKQAEEETWKKKKKEEKKLSELISSLAEPLEKEVRVEAEWAHLNKNQTLEEYIKECRKKDSYRQPAYCIKVIELKTWDNKTDGTKDLEETNIHCEIKKRLEENLLTDMDFLKGTGGDCLDTDKYPGITKEEETALYEQYEQEMREKRQSDVKTAVGNCVLIRENGEDRYVIDAQGHSYARYVGLIGDWWK